MGETNTDRMALMDTGAGISIIPFDVYMIIDKRFRSKIRSTSTRIVAGNDTLCDVRGVCDIRLNIYGSKMKNEFFVCGDASHVIIGYDFQKKHRIHLEPGVDKCWIYENNKYREVPCFDSGQYNKKSKVRMVQNFTVMPNCEAIVPATVQRGSDQDGKVMMIKPSITCFQKTGALICNTIAVPDASCVPVRMVNATNEAITLWKGSVVATAEPVYVCSKWVEPDVGKTKCECKCTCNATSLKDKPMNTEMCCHDLASKK